MRRKTKKEQARTGTKSRRTRDDVQRERQAAVAVHHRDLSTEEIGARIEHAQTLLSMYDAQRTRNQRAISEAGSDLRTCDKMIDELQHDVSTLNALIRSRHAASFALDS